MGIAPDLPKEIATGLHTLRRRIRKVQWTRGLLRSLTVILGGVLLLAGIDFLFAPVPASVRPVLFFAWLAGLAFAVFKFLVRPLTQKLPDVRLARWLENRHPEIEERISTALELSQKPEGVSGDLIKELAKDAALDVDSFDARDEIRSDRVRPSLWPAAALAVVIISLLAVFPRQMGRLLTRAVSPFSSLGNAGAFRFTIKPGDLEILEGDEIAIDLTYEGSLSKDLELLVTKDGQTLSEPLRPTKSDGDTHLFEYRLSSAETGFQYAARVGGSESDQFEVRVWPLPILREATVRYQYPAYTEWPDQTTELGAGIKAFAGTEVTLTGSFGTPLESGELHFGARRLGDLDLERSSSGTGVSWRQTLAPGFNGKATLQVKHRLGRDLVGATFLLESLPDPAPTVKILTPVQRELKMRPDDQIILTYEVKEAIGLSQAEIQIEVGGSLVEPLLELLPERSANLHPDLWSGEAMVYLGALLPRLGNVSEFRLRLAISDNRPADLEGPGVGFSEWLTVKLDKHAESLVRQELRKQESDFKKTIEDAVRDVRQAQQQLHRANGQMEKEELPKHAVESLAKAGEKLAEAEKKLADLSGRMKQSVQAHRRDEIASAQQKLAQARTETESAPLQDTAESRRAEIESALQNAEEAIQDLEEQRNEAHQDRQKIEDLAKLQELAQKQEQLARQAAAQTEEAPDKNWQKEQRRVQNQIREQVRQSPEARQASLEAQMEQAKALTKEAEALQESQKNLSKMAAQETPSAEELVAALAREQEAVVEQAKQELTEARKNLEERANELPEAVAQAEATLESAQKSDIQQAAESASKAFEELAKGAEASPSQKELQAKQEDIAGALKALAEGNQKEALAAVEKMQAERAGELAQEIKDLAQADGDQLGWAREESKKGARNAERAVKAQQSGKNKQASEQHQQSSQKFEETAKALDHAAEQFAQQAEQASQQEENQNQAPAPGDQLAEAFQQSAKASRADKSESAAKNAKAAAESLRNAAEQARSMMSQGQQPGEGDEAMAQAQKPGKKKDQKGQPGSEPQEGPQETQPDQGVPPRLAKLGITAKDWEKIRATLKTDVSGSGDAVIPEDYRGLVKQYFEQVSQEQ